MNRSDPLLTDHYTLVMAQSFWRHGSAEEATAFDLFVRELPPSRNYLVAAGLADALEYLEGFSFREGDIDFLRSTGIFDGAFLEYLRRLRFTGTVRAIREGSVIPAKAPILSVRADRVQTAIVEPALLAIVNHQTMIASKAARIVEAARGRTVSDFSLRRLHGPMASLGVARAAYIAGVAATSTVAAGRDHGIPTGGTMAHHYIQSFGPGREQQAFEQFLSDYPDENILLVDTWDTIEGVKRAIAASRQTGVALRGIRLDSGDLIELSKECRRILDAAGCPGTAIFASGDLDEYRIRELLDAGAPVDSFGAGTRLGTSADAPYLGAVFKLVAQGPVPDGETDPERLTPMMKLSVDKETDPGEHQLWRVDDHRFLLGLIDERPPRPEASPLLETVMSSGSRDAAGYLRPTLSDIRRFCRRQVAGLPDDVREIDATGKLELLRSPALERLSAELAGRRT